jgi:hypothetical protein
MLRGDSGDANNFRDFDTVNSVNDPVVYMFVDGVPHAPNPISPADGAVVENLTPTLRSGKAADENAGDNDYVDYCWVQSATPVTAGDIGCDDQHSSGWLDNGQPFTFPSGDLFDGRTYYWKVKTADGYMVNPNNGFGINGWATTGMSYNESSAQSFSVSLPHLGSDSSLPGLSESLPQGGSALVNEANGNLYGVDPVWLTPRCFRGKPEGGADDGHDEAAVSAGVSAGGDQVVARGRSLAQAAGG